MMRNEKEYPDPDNFRPERWLEPDWPTYKEPLTEFPTIKGMSSFGWGIRTCLGQTLSQDELLLICGGLVWAFDLKHKVDPVTGVKIEVPTDSTSEVITKPLPFQMAFVPRTKKRRAEIVSNWIEADTKDKQDRLEFLRLATMP
jgi:cytochrome P450